MFWAAHHLADADKFGSSEKSYRNDEGVAGPMDEQRLNESNSQRLATWHMCEEGGEGGITPGGPEGFARRMG